jgi:broad specificity phosphatase PhoE
VAEHRQVWLIRHGETEWSKSGQHTSRTDLPLTEVGVAQARALGETLADHAFATVLSSPMTRALETCRLAGLGPIVETDSDLAEWNYGEYEGRKTIDIQKERPGWLLWRDGVVGGETAEDVRARAAKVIDRVVAAEGDVALFSHGHFLRVLTACWLTLPATDGQFFALDTATISILSFEYDYRVIKRWNQGSRTIGS